MIVGELSIFNLLVWTFFKIYKLVVKWLKSYGYLHREHFIFEQVLNRVSDTKPFERPILQQLQPILPQHFITSGTRKDCIRLRGLPYEALVEHILEFLGEHSKNIEYQGVHMVYNAQVN